MHCRVHEASYTSSLHFLQTKKQYYSLVFLAIFVPHLPILRLEPAKNRKKLT